MARWRAEAGGSRGGGEEGRFLEGGGAVRSRRARVERDERRGRGADLLDGPRELREALVERVLRVGQEDRLVDAGEGLHERILEEGGRADGEGARLVLEEGAHRREHRRTKLGVLVEPEELVVVGGGPVASRMSYRM